VDDDGNPTPDGSHFVSQALSACTGCSPSQEN
jgi:hypothetical protein